MTTNKNLNQPAFNSAAWDVPLNANFGFIDLALGGTTALNVTAASGTIVLTSSQYTPLILSITGTLTANVNYQIPAGVGGQWIVSNAATGAFTVTISSGGGGSSLIVESGDTRQIYSNGTSVLPTDEPAFPAGTVMLFAQTSAPTGWTKSTTHNNKALRVVNGTAGSGGTVSFTSAFASQAVVGTVGDTALTIAQIPAHTHLVGTGNWVQSIGTGLNGAYEYRGSVTPTQQASGSAGSGDAHTHTFTGTAIDLAVAYVDVIIASKD